MNEQGRRKSFRFDDVALWNADHRHRRIATDNEFASGDQNFSVPQSLSVRRALCLKISLLPTQTAQVDITVDLFGKVTGRAAVIKCPEGLSKTLDTGPSIFGIVPK